MVNDGREESPEPKSHRTKNFESLSLQSPKELNERLKEILKQDPAPENQNISMLVFKEAFDQYGNKLKVDLDSSIDSVDSVIDLEHNQVEPVEINEEEEEDFIKE